MKLIGANAVDTEMAMRGLSARTWLSPREPRQKVPPPILLCQPNLSSTRAVQQVAKTEKPIAEKPSFKVAFRFPAQSSWATLKNLQSASGLLSRAMNWIRERQSGRSGGRRLKVTETVHLGEKRFVAVIQMDGNQYLVGGGATNVSLLAQLKGVESFDDLLKKTLSVPETQILGPAIEHTRELA